MPANVVSCCSFTLYVSLCVINLRDDCDCGCVVSQPEKDCHNISTCGLTTKLPANITVASDMPASTTAMAVVAATNQSLVNSTSSEKPKTSQDVDTRSNIALMLREENPSVAFDAQYHLFYIVDDGDIYLSRFDIDPLKDTGGTLRVKIKFRQYDHVSVTLCWY